MGEYQPGMCNIGSAEIANRKRTGWVAVAATAILGLALVLLHVSAFWRLSLFVPAFFAATGFLQGFMHFCAGFGMRGVFNFGPQVGKTEKVEQAEYRRKDKQKALQILAYSALIATVVATAIFFLPLWMYTLPTITSRGETVGFIKVHPFKAQGRNFTVKPTSQTDLKEVNVDDYVRNIISSLSQTFEPMSINIQLDEVDLTRFT